MMSEIEKTRKVLLTAILDFSEMSYANGFSDGSGNTRPGKISEANTDYLAIKHRIEKAVEDLEQVSQK